MKIATARLARNSTYYKQYSYVDIFRDSRSAVAFSLLGHAAVLAFSACRASVVPPLHSDLPEFREGPYDSQYVVWFTSIALLKVEEL